MVQEMLEQNLTTLDYYYDIYEELSDERDDLHSQIIKSILSRKRYSTGRKIFMLGGAPANGKSTFLKSKIVEYPKAAIKIDPDEIKTMLPEYTIMTKMHEPLASSIVHEESSFIAKEIRRISIEAGYDIIIDGVANDTLYRRLQDIEELRSNGHYIRIDYVTIDTFLSLKLADLRYKFTGRQVPETYIIEKNRKIALLIPELIENKAFDELYLWDTNIQNTPRLILSQKKGKLNLINEVLYENFKRKAND